MVYTETLMKQGADNMAQSDFQKWLPWLLVLDTIWIAIGRLLFGVGGWGVIATLFYGIPILFLYTILISNALYYKSKRGYKMSRWTQYIFVALLVSMFAFGFFMLDGGDTRESYESVFTSLFGVNGASTTNDVEHPILSLSDAMATFSYIVSLILLIVGPIKLFMDKNGIYPTAVASTVDEPAVTSSAPPHSDNTL